MLFPKNIGHPVIIQKEVYILIHFDLKRIRQSKLSRERDNLNCRSRSYRPKNHYQLVEELHL